MQELAQINSKGEQLFDCLITDAVLGAIVFDAHQNCFDPLFICLDSRRSEQSQLPAMITSNNSFNRREGPK